MNYKKLGNTDLDVSTICLGTMTWGEQNTQEEGFMTQLLSFDSSILCLMFPSLIRNV